ncbi:MAG: alpha/beta fold hydrolase [Bacteroidia bacterium]
MMKSQKQTQSTFGPPPFILGSIKAFFKLAGNLAPELALKVLWRLIFHTRRKSFKPPHHTMIEQGDEMRFKVRVDKIPTPVLSLTAYRWGKSDRKIFLVHGWEAHALDFYKMIPTLVDAGFEVIALDAPAHGKSEGSEVNLIAVKQAIYQAILRFGIPYAVIGHSFGGYASAFTLSEYPVEVEKLIMIASPVYGSHMFEQICATLGVPAQLQNRLFEALKERFERPIESFNLVDLSQPIKAREIHYLYDEGDEMVSHNDVEKLFKAKPYINAKSFNGVGHFKMPRNEEVIERVVEVLESEDMKKSPIRRKRSIAIS